ncbi:amino acid adenylation domain-containing protein [Streptomyces sp. MI02-7b]|uniref:non-ribosomal peptide synthetase n=1 Tax=Streptomyces sp. MI02-7b TaxID=462941 RepID=UPI0029B71900|nr:amino acid adenylation domain-containing protein [Streptomyces sp. MI02-7b]MDX3073771.1 amino acid adenylation domain-containing protein [Streptomyces sp. MI02-7b]
MNTAADTGREFWRGVLTAGGFTAIPRWTADPSPGLGEHAAAVPADLVAALDRLTGELGVPFGSVLLAAHAKVLAALAGEPDVTTGWVAAADTPPLPCRLSTRPATWRALARDAHRAASAVSAHQDVPLDALLRELGRTGPAFETVLDPTGGGSAVDPTGTTVLWLGVTGQDSPRGLRLRYRTDVLDADSAARIVGYHLAALRLMADGPDDEHGRQSLLSPAELHLQLEEMGGPRRELPRRPFHELFEERVRAHPDAVAAVHGDRRWTYRELNARANRLGRALLARGLRREGVVAVVTERNLDWMATVLAVLKTGGVYLPVEPHFPAGRIATVLSRAGCALVVTEPGSTATLDQALPDLPGVRKMLVGTAYEEDHAGSDLGIPVAPDQLAYIYFTSGSTGEPKGAMCEHAGFLNHLLAKIEDLGIAEGQVVAQTAPQCFDISLWQLVSALLTGGRTLIVEQDVILDVDRFLDRIAEGRVAVLQVVPSYLEVVLTALERRPRDLPDLRCVSVTGEALKKELTQRWFTARPGVTLVNAYGLTETSDDTNHAVMHRPPDTGWVPLGPPVRNVSVYVVDEHLSPVPLGAPGLIVFSGVCVGRGYVNDPERTRQAFGEDPHHPGRRLYRAGDYGRWHPGGTLEFLGRQDSQVKVRGFRIEIGEIENALVRVPGVRDGAVVVVDGADGGARLVAFHSGPQPVETVALRERMGRSLPAYMIPSAFHWREILPLTANSKIDRKALTALAGELDVPEDERQAPRTPAERRLAAAWAQVLGIPEDRVDRRDDFFERGGTSLAAVRMAILLDRAVSLKDVTRHPVLADLAGLLGAGATGGSARRSGLLQQLNPGDPARAGVLVCFPYAGGNAVNFQPMAKALGNGGPAVLAVELPGHDPAADGEPFAPMTQVVEQVAAEVAARGAGPVMLWGHSSGAAYALETTRRLLERGVAVRRVFLAAQLLGDAAGRRAEVAELTALGDAELTLGLNAYGGHPELGELDAARAGHVAAAYRHDCVSAHRYLAHALEKPWAARLTVPVTVVVADDDPRTADHRRRYPEWRLLAEHVDLHEIAGGGHYFLRTCPEAAAAAVLRAVPLPATS